MPEPCTRTVWLCYGPWCWVVVSGTGLARVCVPGASVCAWVAPNAAAESGWSSTQTGGIDA